MLLTPMPASRVSFATRFGSIWVGSPTISMASYPNRATRSTESAVSSPK